MLSSLSCNVQRGSAPFRNAGADNGLLKEFISPFLKQKIAEAKLHPLGEKNPVFQALTRQYNYSPLESRVLPKERLRHYQSGCSVPFEGKPLKGVERLYRRTVLLEPTTYCAAHCRWCLRGQYPIESLKADDISRATRYFGSSDLANDVNEILITGGDPLTVPKVFDTCLSELSKNATNIKIVRIGSRLVYHEPAQIAKILPILAKYPEFRYEVAVHCCHPVETEWPESKAAIESLQKVGCKIYMQHPLLKGVNDDVQTLVTMYDNLRAQGVETHYMFHPIPMVGTNHHRIPLKKGLDLALEVSASGYMSGRAKPKFAILSDIGKIVLYDGCILDSRGSDNSLLIKSGFRLSDRKRWNPSWEIPDSVVLDKDGDTMLTWYMDAVPE